MKSQLLAGAFAVLLASPVFSQDPDTVPGTGGSDKDAPSVADKPDEVTIMATHCYTDRQDCSGDAPFIANGRLWHCTIYWNHGTNGHSSFTLFPRDTAVYRVRYNDTATCETGGVTYGPYYIWVP
jgi:hypothetical protein